MPRIFDCFIFFNELDLLEIRLNELDSVVDRFVLCEAPVTFKGKSKELVFKENRERFAPFLHKITHVVVDDFPKGPDTKATYWKRQKFQRNAIRRGLVDAEPSDLVILSDLDEIPRASAIETIAGYSGKPRVFSLEMHDHRLFLNLRRAPKWNKSRVARFGDIRTMERLRGGGPTWWPNHASFMHTVRQWKRMSFGMRRIRPWTIMPDAGWHFSYMGGAEKVSQKLDAVSAVRPIAQTSTKAVTENIAMTLEDISQSRARKGARLIALDQSFPTQLLSNQDRYAHLIADRETCERFGVTPPQSIS